LANNDKWSDSMEPTEKAVSDLAQQWIDLQRESVERTIDLEANLLETIRRNAADVPGVNGMVDMASDLSMSALQMRGQLWRSWFDQLSNAADARTPATGDGSAPTDER
jgi:hypothetical protein